MNKPTSDGDPTAELLAQSLRQEADLVHTDPSALQQIQRRTQHDPARSRRGWTLGALGAGLAAASVITAVVLIADSNDNDGSRVATSPSNTAEPTTGGPTTEPPTTGSEPTVAPMHEAVFDPTGTNVSLYYVDIVRFPAESGGQQGNVYLYAEPHTVSDTSTLAAVREFLTSYPLDPDYESGWPEGVDVSGIESVGDESTIALFGDADLESAPDLVDADIANEEAARTQAAEMAIQGLIRTARITDGTVSLTYNDEPLTRLLGVDVSQGVDVLPELSNDSSVKTRAEVQITSPVEGQVLTSPVVVRGNGNIFEGTVNWQLLDDQGRELDTGYTTTAFGEWADFEVDLGTLEPGTYTFTALEYSAFNGDPIVHDDKTFTVQ